MAWTVTRKNQVNQGGQPELLLTFSDGNSKFSRNFRIQMSTTEATIADYAAREIEAFEVPVQKALTFPDGPVTPLKIAPIVDLERDAFSAAHAFYVRTERARDAGYKTDQDVAVAKTEAAKLYKDAFLDIV